MASSPSSDVNFGVRTPSAVMPPNAKITLAVVTRGVWLAKNDSGSVFDSVLQKTVVFSLVSVLRN